jgi:hypothetical protein
MRKRVKYQVYFDSGEPFNGLQLLPEITEWVNENGIELRKGEYIGLTDTKDKKTFNDYMNRNAELTILVDKIFYDPSANIIHVWCVNEE